MQSKIQELIRQHERDIEKLLETKRKADTEDIVYAITELVVIQKQNFICELRALL